MKRITLMSIAALALTACDSSEDPETAAKKNAPADPQTAAKVEAPTPAPKPEPAMPALASAELGEPAPDFELSNLDGETIKLSDHKGKTVVLEWFNPECPFVKFAHGEGPLQSMAKDQTDKGVVWLAINSGAPGKQGHGVETNKAGAQTFGLEHPILLDESGAIGKTYGAKTTPHIFIVDPGGKLVFRGGVDNAPLGEVKEGGELQTYVTTALAALAAGKPIEDADVRSYGCSVKYAS